MSAPMPEREPQAYLCVDGIGLLLTDFARGPDIFVKQNEWLALYDRLLAAEARLAEVEAELDAERRGASEIARLAEAEIATLRAERDALVELVRDVACSGVAFEDKRLDYVEIQIDTDTWAQARAILAREAGE